jgi:thiamine biosynthesis lipoprotein
VGVDLGGIAKGWTVDLAVDRARSAGARWIVVSAGGDLRIGGRAPVVPIGIDDPDSPGCSIATLRPDRGALATSSTVRRSWGPGLHHLIDPRTGAPAVTDAVQATVWAPTCTEAEVAAKVALLTGTPAAADVPAAIIGVDGRVHVSFRSDPTSTDDGREAA